MRTHMGKRLKLHAAKRQHIGRGVLHDEDIIASRAVKTWGLKGRHGGCLYGEARLARRAHNNDVGRWSLEAYGIRRSLSVAFGTNRLHT
jgi:hypothetical protein